MYSIAFKSACQVCQQIVTKAVVKNYEFGVRASIAILPGFGLTLRTSITSSFKKCFTLDILPLREFILWGKVSHGSLGFVTALS